MVGNPIYLVEEMPEIERETIGQRVRRERLARNLYVKDVVEIIQQRYNQKLSISTVRDLELEKYSPNLKTVEWVARALDIPPLELLALGLHQEADKIAAQDAKSFERSRFGRLWRAYEQTKSPRLRALVEDTVQMLTDRLSRN